MKIKSKDFRVRPGEKVNLKEWPTKVKPFGQSKKQDSPLEFFRSLLSPACAVLKGDATFVCADLTAPHSNTRLL